MLRVLGREYCSSGRGRAAHGGCAVVALAIALGSVATLAFDEGWVIERMSVRIQIRTDGVLDIMEGLDVDFRGLSKHGIYRDIPYRMSFDEANIREYKIELKSVTTAEGRRHQADVLSEGANRRFRIGDPDRTISGKETYRIAYTAAGALNAFADHDELYWNATGIWPVQVAAASVIVHGPPGAIEKVACFQGYRGSTEPCRARFTSDEAEFTATRALVEGEQLTVVTAIRKGAVAEPMPMLRARPRHATEYFETTMPIILMMCVGFAGAFGGVMSLWWKVGRDRRFVSVQYLSQDGSEERLPLFGARPIGVEFEPPEKIRPGQVGVLLDERADTLDVTATIVDLAVRGYLTITEIPKEGWFGKADWQLERSRKAADDLLPYERIILTGLFGSLSVRKLSSLKNSFYQDLAKAKTSLYEDAVERGWFPRSPATVRVLTRVAGVVVIALGIAAVVLLGSSWGAGLLGLPVILAGILLAVVAGAMPRRAAAGRELMRRSLGFVKYIKTAERHEQAFAERANIFTAYLPYAIVFKCVDKWARAFRDIDLQATTAGWYFGTTRFDANSFSSSLSSFSSTVSTALASTPGGSGSSGFSGGSSGGGGGGGGGGSW